jgi:hypothetical protein
MLMTLTALFVGYVAAAVPAMIFGYWWRGRADARPVEIKTGTGASTAAAGDETLARFEIQVSSTVISTDIHVNLQLEIQVSSTVISTDIHVNLQQLEHLANGCGKALIDLPSKARH